MRVTKRMGPYIDWTPHGDLVTFVVTCEPWFNLLVIFHWLIGFMVTFYLLFVSPYNVINWLIKKLLRDYDEARHYCKACD